jgi:putative oxidoreductase
MKKEMQCVCWGPTVLRIALGLLFIVPGIMKLMNPAMPTGMLEGMGFPAPMIFAWILLLSEIIFGLALVVGFKVRYAVWPLAVILLVATIMVHVPSTDPMKWINVLFHVVGIAGLVSLFNLGAGSWALDKE